MLQLFDLDKKNYLSVKIIIMLLLDIVFTELETII